MLPFIFKQHETENTGLQQFVAQEQPVRLCRHVSVSNLLYVTCCLVVFQVQFHMNWLSLLSAFLNSHGYQDVADQAVV